MSILKTDRRQEVPDNKLLETILSIESVTFGTLKIINRDFKYT